MIRRFDRNSVGAPYETPIIWPAQPPRILSSRTARDRWRGPGAWALPPETVTNTRRTVRTAAWRRMTVEGKPSLRGGQTAVVAAARRSTMLVWNAIGVPAGVVTENV